MPNVKPPSRSSQKAVASSLVAGSHRKRRSVDEATSIHPLLHLQQTIGNQAVGRMIQAKLNVSQSGDQLEKEADQTADRVMRMPEPTAQHKPAEKEREEVRRQPAEDKERQKQVEDKGEEEQLQKKSEQPEEEKKLQRVPTLQVDKKKLQAKSVGGQGPTVTPHVQSRISSFRGNGKPLPASVRASLEPRFGYDFGGVRIHTDAQGSEIARAVNAKAFTVGHDVVFGAGTYAPETTGGKWLIAHELTHVVSQDRESKVSLQREQDKPKGHVLVGAAAETPVKSVGQYGDLIIEMLTKDKERKLSIQEVVRLAAVSTSITLAAPTTAEAGSQPQGAVTRKFAFIITNADYQDPEVDLPASETAGEKIKALLKAREYNPVWKRNLTAAQMQKEADDFVAKLKEGEQGVLFYSGHGEIEGMKGVDNKFLSSKSVVSWKNDALARGFDLTVIIEACHSGAIADIIRKEESVRIQKAGKESGKNKAEKLGVIAGKLQGIKDDLAKLERAKQALMEEPQYTQLSQKNALDQAIKGKDASIKAAWKEAMPRIIILAEEVKELAKVDLAVPGLTDLMSEWLNTKQLDMLDTMINRTLALARESL